MRTEKEELFLLIGDVEKDICRLRREFDALDATEMPAAAALIAKIRELVKELNRLNEKLRLLNLGDV
jgi:hypothetical protein